MKIRFLIFCFFCLAAFTDCTKIKGYGPSSVKGQAIDNTTGKGVPYADVYVVGAFSGTIGAMGNTQNGYAKADANGNFSISFNWDQGSYYSAYAEAPGYFNDGNAFVELSAGKNDNIKIEMVPKGWVRFYLVNALPADTIQGFILYDFNNDPEDIEPKLFKNKSYLVYGFGNTTTNFTYNILKGSVYTSHSGSVYVKALDTVSYTIKY